MADVEFLRLLYVAEQRPRRADRAGLPVKAALVNVREAELPAQQHRRREVFKALRRALRHGLELSRDELIYMLILLCAGREDDLARRKAAKLVYDVAHRIPVKGRAAELARGHVAERGAALAGSEVYRAYIGALALFEHRAFRHRAGCDYAYDVPLHKPLCQRRVLCLLADSDLVALGDEPRDVGFSAVVRHSAHRCALVGVLNGTVARRQREVKLARGDLRVVVEHLVKVAETEEQQAVLMLLFYFVVLLFHGCKLSHDSFSLSLNGVTGRVKLSHRTAPRCCWR